MVSTRVILLLLCSSLLVGLSFSLSYPLKVVYIDQIDCCAPQDTIINAVNAGYNVIALAFYQTELGVADAALAWSQRTTNKTRAETMKKVHDAGAVVIISIGGANDHRWPHADPVELGTTIANFAKEYQLDGVDFDTEVFGGFGAVNGNDEDTIDYFSTIFSTTRRVLGPNGIISMAPLPPWFGPIGAPKCDKFATIPGCSWVGPSGGLTEVYKRVGDDIDFFFMQYYNQGNCYTTEKGLFIESGPGCTTAGAYYPFTAIKEIAAGGIPLNKIVIGRPVDAWAGVGHHNPVELRQWIESSGKELGWNAGVGIWQWWDIVGSQAVPWINSVYPSSSTNPTRAPTDTPTRTPQPTHLPTHAPTQAPAPTHAATHAPTPTQRPPTAPTTRPTEPTAEPTELPECEDEEDEPTVGPTVGPTAGPTAGPTENPDTGSCTTGHMKCTGASTFSSCAHGVWQANQSCQAGLVCQAFSPYVYCVRA